MIKDIKAGSVIIAIDEPYMECKLMVVYDSYEKEYRTVNIKNGSLSVVAFRDIEDLVEFIRKSSCIINVYDNIIEYNKGRF